MSLIYWIILGFIAGFLAKLIMGGDNSAQNWLFTIILGIVGAFVGGFLSGILKIPAIMVLIGDLTLGSVLSATVGAIIALFIYNKIK